MISAGCDVGSLTAKAVVLRDGVRVGSAVLRGGPDPADSAKRVMRAALDQAKLSLDDVQRCVGTGYGRRRIPFADENASEIVCHARGVIWQDPSVRTLIDIGGQDAKAVRFDGSGAVLRYAYNDRCASGSGRFLEVVADALELELREMEGLAGQSSRQLTLSSQCVVFAETEILSLVNSGHTVADIVNALHHAVARRAAAMVRGIGIDPEVTMSGGVACNGAVLRALGEALGRPLRVLAEPQLAGAIGAALLASDSLGA